MYFSKFARTLVTDLWSLISINEYADVRSNKTLSRLFAQAMANLSSPVDCDFERPTEIAGSTDQGM